MNRYSRRLRGAADRVDEEVAWFRSRAETLTVGACEGDATLFNAIQTQLRLGVQLLTMRFKYIKMAPWCFVKADTVEGARTFIRSATSRPSNEQDPLTNYLHETHRADMLALDDGGVCSELLSKAVSKFDEIPLDETPGEGYHRDTHHSLVRATGARNAYLMQSTRTKANLKLLKRFIRMGPQGKRVLRYEWRAWKRVLQVRRDSLWKPKGRMARDKVFNRIHRMDEEAEFDWSLFGERVLAAGQGLAPEPAPADGRQAEGLRIEYLNCVLNTKQYYSVELPLAGMDEDGRPIERTQRKYFQIIAKTSDRSRPSLMPTNETRADVSQRARLAVCVQEMEVKPGTDAGGQAAVYSNSNALWKAWKDLGPFASVRSSLTRYQLAVGIEDYPGCILVSNPLAAIPDFSPTDFKCPTLTILDELTNRGWVPIRNRVDHTELVVGQYQGTEAIRMKAYLITLLQLEQCLPLTSHIPSDEPIAFYKLLLNGVLTELGLGNRAYLAILHDRPIPAASLPLGDDEVLQHKLLQASKRFLKLSEVIFFIEFYRFVFEELCVCPLW